MSKNLHQPHDHFFKRCLSDPRVAKDFLLQHLPPAIKNAVDFNTLKLSKNSFIDPAFKNAEVDVLYQAKVNQETGFIYTHST